jgi:hypothetical protein
MNKEPMKKIIKFDKKYKKVEWGSWVYLHDDEIDYLYTLINLLTQMKIRKKKFIKDIFT